MRVTVLALRAVVSLVPGCRPYSEEGVGGRWSRRGAPHVPDPDVIEMLESLQYLQGYVPAPDLAGVTVYNRRLACDGLNLIVSGHAPEALLTNMEGDVLHTWSYQFDRIWPSGPPGNLPENTGRNYWRRVRLLPDGSLLAVFEGQCLIKLDRDSRLLWVFSERAHHDIDVDEQGNVHTLVREAHIDPRINPSQPIVADYAVILSPSGKEIRRLSLVDCFINSSFGDVIPSGRAAGDIFHTNAVRVLDGTVSALSPLFKKGNLLTSLCVPNTIAIIDPGQRAAVWARTGPWIAQHDPWLLENGNILLFDNLGGGSSRVLEYDPVHNEVEWAYPDGPDTLLYSRTCGACQRLPNGNTLITESDSGRALEVTLDGRVVWEYVNPHRAGNQGELIATLLDVIRLTEKPAWLGG
jgi:hypothetical protein